MQNIQGEMQNLKGEMHDIRSGMQDMKGETVLYYFLRSSDEQFQTGFNRDKKIRFQ